LAATCMGDFGLHEQVAYLGQPPAGPQRLRAAAESCGVPLADYASYVHGRRLRTTTAAAARARGRFRADMTCRNASGSRIRSVSKRQVSSKSRRQLRAWATASGSSSRRVNVLVSEEHEKRKHEVERKTSKPDELRKREARQLKKRRKPRRSISRPSCRSSLTSYRSTRTAEKAAARGRPRHSSSKPGGGEGRTREQETQMCR
jgi:hypothetical protein